jgi:hypothetical protein
MERKKGKRRVGERTRKRAREREEERRERVGKKVILEPPPLVLR